MDGCIVRRVSLARAIQLGRVKLLIAAVLFNGIKENWHLVRKILFLVLTAIREILTLLAAGFPLVFRSLAYVRPGY